MEQAIVSAVTHDTSEAKMTLAGVPDRPGVAATVFRALADQEVNVDMIVQNVSDHGVTDISFTVPHADLDNAMSHTERLATEVQWAMTPGGLDAQLATDSKIFSGSPTAFGAEPNTQANLVDLGMPGVLPVLNRKAVEYAVRFGRAIDAHVAERSVFERKNYFYPDLPKGYQISQAELPIVGIGHVEILMQDGEVKTVGVTRAHLEEAGIATSDDQPLPGFDRFYAADPFGNRLEFLAPAG